MRTIDADAFCDFLREVSTRQHYEELLCNKEKYPTVADVIEAICCDLDGTGLHGFDNAPTVNKPPYAIVTFDKDELEQIVRDKVIEPIKNGELVVKTEERPQGEWIKDIQGDTICSNCGFECTYNEEGLYSLGRYCHHCGAEMMKEE